MRTLRLLLRFLRPYWLWAILAPLSMVLEVAMDLLQPRLLQTIVDQGIANRDFSLTVRTGVLMVVVAIVGLFAGMGCTFFAVLAGQGFGTDLRAALFRKVQSFSFGNLDRLSTGSLITRLTSDVGQVQDLVMLVLRTMVRAPLLLIGGLIMAILTSARLGLLFLALIPVVLVALTLIIRKSYPVARQVQNTLDTLNTVMQENLLGVRVVKAFARADYEVERFGVVNERLTGWNLLAARLAALTMPAMTLTVNVGVVAALWIGGVAVQAGQMHVGQVVAFINYLTQTLMALLFVSMMVLQVSRAEASAQRVGDVMDDVPLVQDPAEPVRLPEPVQGRVAFENVTFDYDAAGEGRDPVLRNVSLVAEPGQTVALLGATGSGKSSLVDLVPRFYDVTEGRVTLDGVDVRDIAQGDLRSHVVIALQESTLFAGTIRDNIRWGRPDATDAEVEEVARIAEADEFIRRFPNGYDTVIGQQGVGLSGGQKQRIAIARALLLKPAVLILDDSTSAVDMRTEARIHAAIDAQPFRQTRFVVAQRISTVKGADRILILDDGRIVAEGDHDSLLATSPIYREIAESQEQHGGSLTDGD